MAQDQTRIELLHWESASISNGGKDLIKVVGAGFGRTGTLSLKNALQLLGFTQCYHMMEVYQKQDHFQIWVDAHQGKHVDWDALFEGYQASVDWPSCNLWREQAAHFPDSKILLSLRDPESWYDSIMNTIYPSSSSLVNSEDPAMQKFGHWAMDMIWNPIFGGNMEDRAHVIDVYNKHNQSVIDEVPSDRLLVFEAKQGWEPLCHFLEVPVPNEDYPYVNTTQEFNDTRSQDRKDGTSD